MNYWEIYRECNKIKSLILEQSLTEAFQKLRLIPKLYLTGDTLTEIENFEMTYKYMLQYNINNTADTNRQQIYENLQRSLLLIIDHICYTARNISPEMSIYYAKDKGITKDLQLDEVNTLLDQLNVFISIDELLENIPVEVREQNKVEFHHQHFNDIFNRLLIKNHLGKNEYYLYSTIFHSENFHWFDKCTLVSGLTISLLTNFDTEKFRLLAEVFLIGETQVMERALAGFILSILKFENRLSLFPNIKKELTKISTSPFFNDHFLLLALQLIKSVDTEKVSKKIQEELLPEVMKAAPKLTDKLDIENILSEFDKEDKNPDWEYFFKDSPDLYKKMEEISNLQMEGSDVFIGAFSMLKHFPFFNTLSNWLTPFYPDNDFLLNDISNHQLNGLIREFMLSLQKAPYLCNSDKYSFCFNLKNMPETQLGMMIDMFTAEIHNLEELQKEDEQLNKEHKSRSIYTQYLQDIYRFYKIFPLKKQFEDIFKSNFNLYKHSFSDILFKDFSLLKQIGEFYFIKDHYDEALEVFLLLEEKGDDTVVLLQKIAYAYQKSKKYENALSYYLKADMLESSNPWNLKKIALCYRFLKDYHNSLKYYKEAEQIEPDNLYIQVYIGHTYVDLKEYEKALTYYYKVEYLAPENIKLLRPIAWISLATGRLDDAENYYKKIPETEKSKYDLINLGHLYWCKGKKEVASDYYLKALFEKNAEVELVEKSILEDAELLFSLGADPSDLPLMIDYLKYKVLNKDI